MTDWVQNINHKHYGFDFPKAEIHIEVGMQIAWYKSVENTVENMEVTASSSPIFNAPRGSLLGLKVDNLEVI